MKSRHQSLVHRAVAAQLDIEPGAIADHHRLGTDLALDRFDLLMIALRIAGWIDGKSEFPSHEMRVTMQVGELVDIVRGWEIGAEPEDEDDEEEEMPETLRPSLIAALEHRESFF